jgi:hypothetical protein
MEEESPKTVLIESPPTMIDMDISSLPDLSILLGDILDDKSFDLITEFGDDGVMVRVVCFYWGKSKFSQDSF